MPLLRSQAAALLLAGLCATSCELVPGATGPGGEGSAPPAPAAEGDAAVSTAIAEHLASRRTGLAPEVLPRLARAIVREARARGFEPSLVLAVIEVESGFRPDAVSAAGACGLMQIRPATGEALARRLGMPWSGKATLLDPVANVKLGVAYLAELRERFGRLPAALAAYNWGPARIGRRLGRGAPLPAAYPRRVFDAYAVHARAVVGRS